MFHPGKESFPLTFENIHEEQQNDAIMLALAQQGTYSKETYYGTELIVYEKQGKKKIMLPNTLHIPALT